MARRTRGQAKKKRRSGYYLLYRREGFQKVWLYEYLQKHEFKARERDGWKIIKI